MSIIWFSRWPLGEALKEANVNKENSFFWKEKWKKETIRILIRFIDNQPKVTQRIWNKGFLNATTCLIINIVISYQPSVFVLYSRTTRGYAINAVTNKHFKNK